MMKKIKDWFAIENNLNLVRDLLFVGSLLFALIAGLICCAPRASAAELDSTEEATEITYVPTNVINRFKMGPYIDLDENGITKYDGKYFTGELLDYFVLLEGTSGDYYVYTYNQHGDNWTTDAGDGTEITYTTGVKYDAARNALIRDYVVEEKLYYCSGIGSEWTEAAPVTPFNTQDGVLVNMAGYTMIGATNNVCTAGTYTTYYKPPYTQPVYDPVDNTLDLSAALFEVAGQAIDFIVSNPIILISTLLFIFVAGTGIIKNFVTGA